MTLGVARNPVATNVPDRLASAAARRGVPVRLIDLPSLGAGVGGEAVVSDRAGPVAVASLAPYLLWGCPAAAHALRVLVLALAARTQNPVDAVLVADNKAATAVRLSLAGVPQVRTEICAHTVSAVSAAAARIGYPVVVKRTHGAQGRWVRRAGDPAALEAALAELAVEGPGALVLQPEIVECAGRSVRAVITGGQVLAVTERAAAGTEWRSNIAGGASQRRVDLTAVEHGLVLAAARAVGLGHAGVDLLRTSQGPRVLEINSCPDFTSMQPYYERDLAEAVLLASL